MTPTAIVRQQAEADAKRNIIEQLKRPTLEMIMAGYDVSDMAFVQGYNIRKMFVAMVEEFEK